MQKIVGLAMSTIVGVAAVAAFWSRPEPVFPATRLRPEGLILNGIDVTGTRQVVVGALGHILLSNDNGSAWQEAGVTPKIESTLTQVKFVSQSTGFAVGHDRLILKTTDGGAHWRQVHVDMREGEPLFDMAAVSETKLIAVGSFGSYLESDDAGQTWHSRDIGVSDRHLYGIAGSGPDLVIAGEQGLVAVTHDGGEHWQKVPPFYNGSFFGVLHTGDDRWTVYGMRGHVYVSRDGGVNWQQSRTDTTGALFGGSVLHDGTIVLAGQGGVVIASRDGGASFTDWQGGGKASYTQLRQSSDGKLLLVGESGLTPEPVPSH